MGGGRTGPWKRANSLCISLKRRCRNYYWLVGLLVLPGLVLLLGRGGASPPSAAHAGPPTEPWNKVAALLEERAEEPGGGGGFLTPQRPPHAAQQVVPLPGSPVHPLPLEGSDSRGRGLQEPRSAEGRASRAEPQAREDVAPGGGQQEEEAASLEHRQEEEEEEEDADAVPRTGEEAAEASLGAQARKVWIFCASQWQDCTCPGTVRWGTKQKYRDLVVDGSTKLDELGTRKIKCSPDELKDIAPGDGSKHCLCEITIGSAYFKVLNPALLADLPEASPPPLTASCDIFRRGASDGPWAAKLWEAEEAFCSEAWATEPGKGLQSPAGSKALGALELRRLQRAWIDRRFLGNYRKLYDSNGWVERAFVNYYAGAPGAKHARMTEELVASIHKFSQVPVVVFHFGSTTPDWWTPERFPRLVLMHAEPLPPGSGRSFNFNKLRAMMLARAKTGVQLDSDQFVAPGVDAMFENTEREVTEDYAMPILPAHFLDRGPKDLGRYWQRYCPAGECSFQSQRWGHAHPTWTYWALPFLGRWLRRNFRDETLPAAKGGRMAALRVMKDVPEDEDLLNVATWEEGGTKQWCKLDLPGPGDFEALLNAEQDAEDCRSGNCGDITRDKRYHPKGVAKVFYTAHHAVDPDETHRYVARLEKLQGRNSNGSILYNRHFYRSGEELRQAHPELTCII